LIAHKLRKEKSGIGEKLIKDTFASYFIMSKHIAAILHLMRHLTAVFRNKRHQGPIDITTYLEECTIG
jgi:hypothetical protein